MCIFFFKAEDGIRDGHVTGVQTCALPISHSGDTPSGILPVAGTGTGSVPRTQEVPQWQLQTSPRKPWRQPSTTTKIGRASCRERVENTEGAKTMNRKSKYQHDAEARKT